MRRGVESDFQQVRLGRRRFVYSLLVSGASISLSACAAPPSTPPAVAPAAAPAAPGAASTAAGAGTAPTTVAQQPAPAVAAARPKPSIPSIPETTVRFGHGTFLGHTEAAIGIEKGWFKELGIQVQPSPYGSVVPSEQRAAVLSAGSVDVVSAGDYAVLPMLKQIPNVRAFTQKDSFLGNGLLAQPDSELKLYQDFAKEGLPRDEAIKRTVAQVKGKRWTYQGTAHTKQFIDIFLGRGGLSESDVTLIPVEDPKAVNLMLSKQADIGTLGAAARVELQTKGFRLLIGSEPVFESAKPSADSKELRILLHTGWVTTTQFADANPDLILRLFGLHYRINQLIKDKPEDAMKIHIPYSNSVTGRTNTPDEVMFLYTQIHPYVTFQDLDRVVNDQSYVLYYKWQLGAKIQGYVEDGFYKEGQVSPDDCTIMPRLYRQLIEFKQKTEADLGQAEQTIKAAKGAGKDVSAAESVVTQAKTHADNFNYLDASRFARAAREWATYVS